MTWTAIASIAACVGVLASVLIAIDARRRAKDADDHVKEQVTATQRIATAAERQVALAEQRDTATVATADVSVEWQVENVSKSAYVLRNLGSVTAEDVTIDEGQIQAIARDLPKGATIPPLASHKFLLMPALGAPLPNEVWVTWRGCSESQAVPLSRIF